jgi:membrane protein
VLGWVRRYREADGQLYAVLLTAYVFVTVLPVAIVVEAYLFRNPTALADHMIQRYGLTGSSAAVLRDALTGTSESKFVSTLFAIANVIVFGLGRVLQLAHARSWGIEARKGPVTDPMRYTSTLLVLLGLLIAYLLQVKLLEGRPGWISTVLVPVWLAAVLVYFVWMPRTLLHRRVSVRDVLPGALLTVALLAGMRVLSSFLLVRWLRSYSKYFGTFGVVMAFFFWLMIAATILIVAAALSPAVAERRSLRKAARAAFPFPDHPDRTILPR